MSPLLRSVCTTPESTDRRAPLRWAVVVALLVLPAACTDAERSERGTGSGVTTTDPIPAGFFDTAPPYMPGADACPPDTAVTDALERATRFLRAQRTPRADATWALGLVAARAPSLGIGEPLAGRRTQDPGDPATRLVDAAAPAWTPTEPPADDALAALSHDMNQVFAAPSAETVAAVDRFTARTDLVGYALTHQWLVLIWAREVGLELPGTVTAREPELAARVHAELGSDGETQDLFAERAALLAYFAPELVTDAEADAWRCRALASQEELGYWRTDGSTEQPYDGGTFTVTAQPEHVTALMALLLAGVGPVA